jgi:hypothetical protein
MRRRPPFTERTAELIAGALAGHHVSAAAQALSLLRSALECDQIGMPAG